MNPTLKNILAGVAALVISGIIVFIVENINSGLYPPPPGLDPHNPEHLSAIVKAMPTPAFLLIGLAHVLGAIAAGIIAQWISKNKRVALVCGSILMVLGVMNFIIIPGQPLWFYAELLLYIPSALMGARLIPAED